MVRPYHNNGKLAPGSIMKGDWCMASAVDGRGPANSSAATRWNTALASSKIGMKTDNSAWRSALWHPRTRAITGLDRNVKLNKQLWSLAQRVANGEPLSLAE